MSHPNDERAVVKSKKRQRPPPADQSRPVLAPKNKFKASEDEEKILPGLITGDLPVEVSIETWSYLTAADIHNLQSVCTYCPRLLRNNYRQLWRIVFARRFGRYACSLFDFTNQPLVRCWQRYIHFFGIQRQSDWLPVVDDRFLNAYIACNPCDRPEYKNVVREQMTLFFKINDMIQWLAGSTPRTLLATELHTLGWSEYLRAACSENTREVFKKEFLQATGTECDFGQIERSFLALLKLPLQALGWMEPRAIRFSWPDLYNRFHGRVSIPNNAVFLDKTLLQKFWPRDLRRECNGFFLLVGVQTQRAKMLLSRIDREGDPHGLLFGELIEDIRFWWI